MYAGLISKSAGMHVFQGQKIFCWSHEIQPFACLTTATHWPLFVAELQIFCPGQIGFKFVGPSACRTLANFFVVELQILCLA